MSRPGLAAVLAFSGAALVASADLAWPRDPTMRQLLPRGAVWRAVAEVGVMSHLHVNGRPVALDNAVFRRPSPEGPAAGRFNRGPYAGTIPVDLTPYLQPGRNCIGLYTRQVDRCDAVFFQGEVVMQSGEVAAVHSDASWRYGQ